MPHGEGHRLTSEIGTSAARLFDLPREMVSDRYEILRHGGGGASTTAICGAVNFDHPAAHHLIKLLPKLIAFDSRSLPHSEWMRSMLNLLAEEARALQPGSEAVMTRLADIVVIQAIRTWIANDPVAQTGWLGALQDDQIGRTIALVHRDPTRTWTLGTLAAEAAMSRSAFAARFSELVGEPAMHYVTRWRMHAALTWLKGEALTVAEAAERLGYQSEAAFSRAFKRFIGTSPGSAARATRAPGRRILPLSGVA